MKPSLPGPENQESDTAVPLLDIPQPPQPSILRSIPLKSGLPDRAPAVVRNLR
jgi:hypothetical protein